MSSNKKKATFSSSFGIDSESSYEKTTNHNTGKVKEVSKQEPHHSSRSTTVTTDGSKWETKDTSTPENRHRYTVKENPATIGYDTSQL